MPVPPPPLVTPPVGPGRFRRAVGAVGATLGFTLLFVGSLVISLVVHLDLAPTRRFARQITNGILGSTFKGSVEVGEIDRLSLYGIKVKYALAYDPSGNEVARVQGLRADTNVIGILQSVVNGNLDVPVPIIHIENVEVALDRAPDGTIGIAEAFLPRNPSPPNPNAVMPHVTLSRIAIDHVWAHGAIAPGADIDGELHYVVGSVLVSPEGVDVKLNPVRIEARAPTPKPLVGDIGFTLRVPPTTGAPPRMEATFDGALGDLDVYLDASMEGRHVAANVGVPRATAEVIGSFLPDPSVKIPLGAPASLVVHAEGDLPDIDVQVKVDFQQSGSVEVGGRLSAATPLTLDLGVDVRRLDPTIVPGFPTATPLDATGNVKLALGPDLVIDANVTTQPLVILNNPIPGVRAHAKLEKGEWTGDADVYEPGAPTKATFKFDKNKKLGFTVDADARSLAAIPRLQGAPLNGSARVKVTGSLTGNTLEARVDSRVDRVRAPGNVELEHATIEAHVEGPLDRLVVREAKVRGKGVRASTYAWETMSVDASGPLMSGSLKVTTLLDGGGGESISAEAAVDPMAKSVRDIGLRIKRSAGEIKGTVDRVGVGPRGVEIGKLVLRGDGIGEMAGTLTVQGKELVGKLHARDVDIDRVARIAGLPLRMGGLANVEVDLASSRQGERRGHIAVEMVNGQAAGVGGVSANLAAIFEGDRVRVDGLVRLVERASPKEKPEERCDGAIASVRVSGGRGVLGGPLLDPDTWKRVSGEVTVAAEDWNLRCLARLVPPGVLPVDVRGKLTTRATVELAPGARLPTVREVLARTKGLVIEGDKELGFSSRQVDVEVKGSFDPKSGVVAARVAIDDGAPIASFGGRTTLDVQRFLDNPSERAAMIQKAPLALRINVPRRAVGAFASLPSVVSKSLPPLAGEIEVKGSIDGTIEAPNVVVDVNGWGLAHAYGVGLPQTDKNGKPIPVQESPWGIPLDLAAQLTYDGRKAKLGLRVKHEDREVVTGDADLAVAIADVIAGKKVVPKGYVKAKIDRLSLGDVPFFSDRGMDGHLKGGIEIAGLGEAPTVKADLDIPDLKMGQDLVYDDASVSFDIGRPKGSQAKDRGSATASVTLSSKTGGKFTTRAYSEIIWKDALVPTIDPNRPADLVVKAQKFRIAALSPFLAGVLSRVDGTLDGDARVGFTKLDDDDKAKIAVRMKLTGGLFHVPQLGQEFHDAEVALNGGNDGVIRMEGLRADGGRGRLTGHGSARFKGLRFAHADATFEIKEGEDLPITLEGVPLGDARGKVTVQADKKGNDLAVVVGVPSFFLTLPPSTGRGVQGLEDNPDIIIKQERPREVEPRPKDPSRLALTFNIGEIGLKGNLGVINIELDVGLSGVKGAPLKVMVADKTQITGDIALTRGRIVLLKRAFEIERGNVHMRPEDAGNPYLNVTARWDSPEGEIFIEYTGVLLPITKEKIKLRSPKLGENEIVAALLSGGAKPSGPNADATSTGQSIAQQLIAQQFSANIAGNISTSLGTSDDGSFRPGLTYNSGDKVIELSTYGASGQQSAGGGAALKGQRTQITVDWRFYRNWSLRGRVDAGSDQTTTGVDLLWQYRY